MSSRYPFRHLGPPGSGPPVVPGPVVPAPVVIPPVVVPGPVIVPPVVVPPVFVPPIVVDDSSSENASDSASDNVPDEHQQPTRTPLRLRRPSDSTASDTESVASGFTEETVTDNGEEHPTDCQARLRRIWQAQTRWNNGIQTLDDKLQHANDGVINGFGNVQHGVAAGADYLYDDIAWPFYQEMTVQIHAAAIIFNLALAHIVAGIINLLRWFFRSLSRTIHWLWQRIGVDFFGVLFQILVLLPPFFWRWGREYAIRARRRVLVWIDDLYDCLVVLAGWLWQVGLDSAAFLGRNFRICIGVLYDCLCVFTHTMIYCLARSYYWLTHDGLKFTILLGIASGLFLSALKGWEGMCLYACDNTAYNNTGLLGNGSLLQASCELDGINNTIQIVHSELAALLNASDTVILTTDNMAHPVSIDVQHPLEELFDNIGNLKTFVRLHQLSDLTINPEDTGAIATIPPQEIPTVYRELSKHARAISNHSEIARHEFTLRYDELNIRLNAIQEYSKENETQSAVGRFISETYHYLLPSAFKSTHAHRQASHYAKVAQKILEDTLTISLLEKPSDVAWRIGEMEELMVTIREQLHGFQGEWTVACQTWKEIWGEGTTYQDVLDSSRGHHFKEPDALFKRMDDASRCEKDPETYVKELDAGIARVKTAAELMLRADAEHKTILQGLVALHKQVHDLFDNTAGWEGEPRTKPLLPSLLDPKSCDGFPRCVGDGNRASINITRMCSRTILRTFVRHVGNMNIKLGRQKRIEVVEVPMGKPGYYMNDDGEIAQHFVHPRFWDNVDYLGKPPPLGQAALWRLWVRQKREEYGEAFDEWEKKWVMD
jgi:hypothetical protein